MMKTPGSMIAEVLRGAGMKPATTRYPFEKLVMPDKFRGKLRFFSEKCIGCKACVRDCPANAIVITKVGDKQFQADINLGRCIYCAQCVDSCPKAALEATGEFELAQIKSDSLKITFHAEAKKPQA